MATASRSAFRVGIALPRRPVAAPRGACAVFISVALVVACLLPPACAAQERQLQASPTADQIVREMVSRNEARAAALPDYSVRQICSVTYRGFPGDRKAEMVVEIHYTRDSGKSYTLISESGSKFIITHALRRLLDSEREAESAENRREIALTPENYKFRLEGQDSTADGRREYILRTEPKAKNKFLFRGRVWIDAEDFAIARIVAKPAKNPSFWLTHTHIEQNYAKFGSFWLPVRNESTSRIRALGGTATLVIQYKDYSLAAGMGPAPGAQPANSSD